MKRRYSHPPILEAVCEIHFELQEPLTAEQIALLEPVWRPSLPKIQTRQEKGVQVRIGLSGVETKDQPQGCRLMAHAEDGKRIAQLSNHFLAVNQLKPYLGWQETFRSDILTRLKEVATHLPITRVKQINLRYIDRLDFPEEPLRWSDWFTFSLPIPPSIPSQGGKIQFQFEQKFADDIGLVLRLVTVKPEQEGHTSVVLDSIISWRGSADIAQCAELLEQVHEPHPRIFDDFLTPRSQALLGAHDV